MKMNRTLDRAARCSLRGTGLVGMFAAKIRKKKVALAHSQPGRLSMRDLRTLHSHPGRRAPSFAGSTSSWTGKIRAFTKYVCL